MRHLLILCTAVLLSVPVLVSAPVLAQQARPRAPANPPAVVAPAPQPEPPPAAYEPELLRLAEVMGALAYLAPLCSSSAILSRDNDWLTRMQQLIEAEGTSPGRRDRLAGAYNRGFIGYQPMHRACTERTRSALDDLLAQGGKLARDLSTRYGA